MSEDDEISEEILMKIAMLESEELEKKRIQNNIDHLYVKQLQEKEEKRRRMEERRNEFETSPKMEFNQRINQQIKSNQNLNSYSDDNREDDSSQSLEDILFPLQSKYKQNSVPNQINLEKKKKKKSNKKYKKKVNRSSDKESPNTRNSNPFENRTNNNRFINNNNCILTHTPRENNSSDDDLDEEYGRIRNGNKNNQASMNESTLNNRLQNLFGIIKKNNQRQETIAKDSPELIEDYEYEDFQMRLMRSPSTFPRNDFALTEDDVISPENRDWLSNNRRRYENRNSPTNHFVFNENSNYEDLLRLDENNVSKGATKSQIKRLNTIKYVKSNNDEKNCTICLEDLEVGDEVFLLPCLHKFHKDCLNPWMKNSKDCPICRQSIF